MLNAASPYIYDVQLVQPNANALDLVLRVKTSEELGLNTRQAGAYTALLDLLEEDSTVAAAVTSLGTMNEFLREQDGRTYQSIPVAVFYTDALQYLSHFVERPAIFPHGRIAAAMQAPRPDETREATWERFMREWADMHRSPLSTVWAFAAVDEMLSVLYERAIGSLP